jgi:Na+-driven multidrug efflux pump
VADPVDKILSAPLRLAVLRFGAPLALGMGMQTAFNLIDAFVISRLGGAVAGPALGAIGICDQLAALGTIVSYGLSVATATLVSRKVGEGDHEAVKEIAWQSLIVIAALSVLFGILGIFGANFVLRTLVGAKGEVANLGVPYLRVMLGGSATIFLLMHLTSVQRALGSSKTPVGLLIGSNVLNFLLAVVMVYGPGDSPAVLSWGRPIAQLLHVPRMGLMGAAWATLIARATALIPLAVERAARGAHHGHAGHAFARGPRVHHADGSERHDGTRHRISPRNHGALRGPRLG